MTTQQLLIYSLSLLAIYTHARVIVQGTHLLLRWYRLDTAREIRDTAATVALSLLYIAAELDWMDKGFWAVTGGFREIIWLTFGLGTGYAFLQALQTREMIYAIHHTCRKGPSDAPQAHSH